MISKSRFGRVAAGVVTAVMFALTVLIPVASAQYVPFDTASATTGSSCANLRTGGFSGVVDCIIIYFNYVVYIVVSLTVVYTVIGAFNMIASEEKREDGKRMVYYGIIGLFLMMSIWGLVNVLDATFRLSGQAPLTPRPFQR